VEKKEEINNLANEIWKSAIKLRGKFKAYEYQAVVLPMLMIRRIECVLIEKRKEFATEFKKKNPNLTEQELSKKVKQKEELILPFFNKSDWTLRKVLDDNRTQLEKNFREYLKEFSPLINDIIDHFNYREMISKMVKANRLDSIMDLVAEEDFSPQKLSNLDMGYIYEELLQKFSQDDAKDTGEHFTPREIIKIMVGLMGIKLDKSMSKSISLYDPACGTGGMLSVAKEFLFEGLSDAEKILANDLILLSGQEYLPQNYAVCKTDMILKGDTKANITLGNSLIQDIESSKEEGDKHFGDKFDYMISNPPFGVNWGEYADDAEKLKNTRYSWGMPDKSNGSFLFLLTMIGKMKPKSDGGSKIAILFNGSPLANGDAGQGDSEIRRHIFENDLLDSLIMIPDKMFYNTGIYTYIWILNNNKPETKKGKVLIVNARDQFAHEKRSFGEKKNKITDTNRKWIIDKHLEYKEDKYCKIFKTTDFAYHKVNLVYWQTDENEQQTNITEPFDVQFNNNNVKTKYKLYGDLDFSIKIKIPEEEKEFEFNLEFNDSESIETLLIEKLKKQLPNLFDSMKTNDMRKWLKSCALEVTYTHRHYVEDVEYVPYDEDVKEFLDREVNNEIISWDVNKKSKGKETNNEILGYEILPNKYFFKYEEPPKSDDLIKEFWDLEKEAEKILKTIRD
jgi:type I restriction enzyme M protein